MQSLWLGRMIPDLKYVIIPGIALTLAALSSLPQGASAKPHLLREWQADGDRGLWYRDTKGGWSYARTKAPCPALAHVRAPSIVGQTSLHLGTERCAVAEILVSTPPR